MERVRMSGNETKARGAAIYLRKAAFVPTSVRLTNLLLSGNRSTTGSAIDSVVGIASGYDFDVSLAHVTAASNSVPTFLRAEPTYSGYGVTVTLTNTLVASATNAFVGTQGAGDGTLVIRHTRTLSHNVAALHYTQAGTPTFQAVDPLGGDPRLDASCHLQFGSAAIDAGVDAGVAMDIDGDARSDGIPDIGADEFTSSMIFVPLILKN
jgi:hypothetical protein